jgi:hypothetical protein
MATDFHVKKRLLKNLKGHGLHGLQPKAPGILWGNSGKLLKGLMKKSNGHNLQTDKSKMYWNTSRFCW